MNVKDYKIGRRIRDFEELYKQARIYCYCEDNQWRILDYNDWRSWQLCYAETMMRTGRVYCADEIAN